MDLPDVRPEWKTLPRAASHRPAAGPSKQTFHTDTLRAQETPKPWYLPLRGSGASESPAKSVSVWIFASVEKGVRGMPGGWYTGA